MRRFTLPRLKFVSLVALGVFAMGTTPALAASYQQIDGTIVDPILCSTCPGGLHPYAGANLVPGGGFQDLHLEGATLDRADFSDVTAWDSGLNGASFREANLSGARFVDSSLRNIDFTGADLRNFALPYGSFSGSIFEGADLRGSYSAGTGFEYVQAAGTDFRASAHYVADFAFANLRNASFTGASLNDAGFSGSNLEGADFRNTRLEAAYFNGTSVEGADFSGARFPLAIGLGTVVGTPLYDAATDFSEAYSDFRELVPFDPVAAGWQLVPEPSTTVLLLMGLGGLARNRAGSRSPR